MTMTNTWSSEQLIKALNRVCVEAALLIAFADERSPIAISDRDENQRETLDRCLKDGGLPVGLIWVHELPGRYRISTFTIPQPSEDAVEFAVIRLGVYANRCAREMKKQNPDFPVDIDGEPFKDRLADDQRVQ